MSGYPEYGSWADVEARHEALYGDDGRSRRLQRLDPDDEFDASDPGNYS